MAAHLLQCFQLQHLPSLPSHEGLRCPRPSTFSLTPSFQASFLCFPFRQSNPLFRPRRVIASGMVEKLASPARESSDSDDDVEVEDSYLADEAERRKWRDKIRQVIEKSPEIEAEMDPLRKRMKMQQLLAEYPLVVEEDDPSWPEDADGWGFKLGQFFDKITIKNVRKNQDDGDYDSDNEIVWHDDDYIRPIKDIKFAEWEDTVFKDISPLIILVHNRYKRPKENEKARNELEKAVHIVWNCSLPSPRCVAVDAVVEDELVSALNVSIFPEIIFTKSGRILYREKDIRSADELSKMMAYFYYGAAKPPCLSSSENSQELIPSVVINR